MYTVYLLQSKRNGSLYIGYSRDIKRRLSEHNDGKVASTAPYRPYKMIYGELFVNRKDATLREKYLKTGWGRNYLHKTLQNTIGNKI
jgi:putative endonuclease